MVLLIFAHVGVGGGGDSGQGSLSSSGGASGFSVNAFSNSTCQDDTYTIQRNTYIHLLEVRQKMMRQAFFFKFLLNKCRCSGINCISSLKEMLEKHWVEAQY